MLDFAGRFIVQLETRFSFGAFISKIHYVISMFQSLSIGASSIPFFFTMWTFYQWFFVSLSILFRIPLKIVTSMVFDIIDKHKNRWHFMWLTHAKGKQKISIKQKGLKIIRDNVKILNEHSEIILCKIYQKLTHPSLWLL